MIKVRLAVKEDLPNILEIYNDVILRTTAVYDYHPHTLSMREAWFETKQKDALPVFIAEEYGMILGFSSMGPFRAWAAYQYSVEDSIYVAAGMRGKGIGRLLLKPLIEAAGQKNMHTIIAGIDASNQASLKLHQSFDFVEAAHLKEVGYKFNRWLDLKFLQLILDGSGRVK